MWGAIKDRWTRAKQLADAARATGPRSRTPEFGVGEVLRGIVGKELHQSDAADPYFQTALAKEIEKDVPAHKHELFDRDFKVAEQQQEEAKQQAAEVIAQQQARERQEWLDKTANSPAAKSGFSDDERWALQQKHRDFKAHRKAGTLDEFAKQYPTSVTARERAISNRIPSSLDMDY